MIVTGKQHISDLAGAIIDNVRPGVGSFLNIFGRKREDHTRFQIWVYLSDWAITNGGIEVASSDAVTEFDYHDLANKRIQNVEFLDSEELHINLSDSVVIEIWSNDHEYGPCAEMLVLYQDDLAHSVILSDGPSG